MTLSTLINRFLNHYRQERKSTSTLSSYATDLRQFSTVVRERDIVHLKNTEIIDAIRKSVRQFSTNSQARKLSTIKAFLSWCYRQGFIHTDLTKHIVMPKRHAVRPTKPLTSSQLFRLRRAATPMERLLLELVLQTGMRLRDIVALRSHHVSDRTVIVPSSGLKLPLAEPLQKALARYELIRPAKERSAKLSNARGRSVSVRTATTILNHLGKRAGVRDATARNLRTTFIVRQLDAGVPFPTIQKITGLQTLESLSPYLRLNVQQIQKSLIATAEV